MLKDLVIKTRSYRRFYHDVKIEKQTLIELVDIARKTPSARNLQPLKYILANDTKEKNFIFSQLRWAGYLDWEGPAEDERPSAYIIVLYDKNISNSPFIDAGISAQTILLSAVEMGFGGCIVGSVNKEEVAKFFNLPENLEIIFVIAIGKPKEKVVLEELQPDSSIKYWRDAENVHYVPKRTLEEIIINH